MDHIGSFVNFIICLHFKKIKIYRYILCKIAIDTGLKYMLGWELVKNEPVEKVIIEACKVSNLKLIEKIIDKVADLKHACFVAGYFNNIVLLKYLIEKSPFCFKQKNAAAGLFGLRYGVEYFSYYEIRYTNYCDIFDLIPEQYRHYKEFRAICFKNSCHVVKDYYKKKIMEIQFNYSLYLREGFYGACEGGNIKTVIFLIEKGITQINKGLYFAKKYNNKIVANYLIEKGAIDPINIIKESDDEFLELIL